MTAVVPDTTATLMAKEPLSPGVYRITLEVSDAQGLTCPDAQTLEIQVCTCDKGGRCDSKKSQEEQTSSSVRVGMPAISLMLLGVGFLLCKSSPTAAIDTSSQDKKDKRNIGTCIRCRTQSADFEYTLSGTDFDFTLSEAESLESV